MASPMISATRPSGPIDLRRPAEYPIVLGDSLKQTSSSKSQFLNLRFNWQPKSGFSERKSKLTQQSHNYELNVNDEDGSDSSSFVYSGRTRTDPSEASDDKSRSLALVFDKTKACFVLESISTSLDLNLVSAPGQTLEDVQSHPQISGSVKRASDATDTNGEGVTFGSDNDEPDPNNPFDYRNFLAEAKENAEKVQQAVGGARTPLPGNRTPMSGFASPIPGASRFLSISSQPTTARPPPTSAPVTKSKHDEPRKPTGRLGSPIKQRSPQQERKSARKASTSHNQPLSKERISDSDEEMGDTITIARAGPPARSQPNKKGHARNVSSGIGRSPHIVVNDGDLEIDMGSPPRDAVRKRGRIDAGAFRSHTGTPIVGRTPQRRPHIDEDIEMRDGGNGSDGIEDGDVEELELGSPRTSRMSLGGNSEPPSSTFVPSRREREQDRERQHETAPTPPANNQALEDDDEDLLAAELEAALEEEDNENEAATGLGLGISGATSHHHHHHHNHHAQQDDESEVSEEE